MRLLVTLSLLLAIMPSAFAADICAKQNPTTYDMLECLSIQNKAADKALNQAYQKLLNSYSGNHQKKALIKAESDWIRFRDSQCAFEGSQVEGGTAEPVYYGSCIVDITKDRTKILTELLKYNH